MPKDINAEIENAAEIMQKSTQDPKEALFKAIRELGPEGLRERLPSLTKSEQEILKDALSEMAKAVSMDDQYQAKYVQGNINDTKLQEDKADDDQDEKLVKPEAAKMNHQGTPVEGWEGQVIKAEDMKEEAKEEAADKMMAMEEKEHGTKDPKKLVAAEKKEHKEENKEMKKSFKEEMLEFYPDEVSKAKEGFEKAKAFLTDKGSKDAEGNAKKIGELKYGKEAFEKAMTPEAPLRKAVWAPENHLLRAMGNGQNHHFSVNDYYNDIIAKSEQPEEAAEVLAKSDKEDLNDLISKGKDLSWDEVRCDKQLEINKSKVDGKFSKSFQLSEIAEALGLTEEQAKQLLGE